MGHSVETYRSVVQTVDLDGFGQMSPLAYAASFDCATWQFLARLNLTRGALKRKCRGVAVLDQRTQFHLDAVDGDLLEARSSLVAYSATTLRLRHCLYRSETGREIAVSEVLLACLDRRTRLSVPLPPEVVASARELMDEPPAVAIEPATA